MNPTIIEATASMTNAIIRLTGSAFANAISLAFVSIVSGFSSVSWAVFSSVFSSFMGYPPLLFSKKFNIYLYSKLISISSKYFRFVQKTKPRWRICHYIANALICDS
jgi:hypothetical protein